MSRVGLLVNYWCLKYISWGHATKMSAKLPHKWCLETSAISDFSQRMTKYWANFFVQIVYLIVDFSVEKIRNNKLIMRLQVFIKSFDKLHGTGYSCTLVTMTTLEFHVHVHVCMYRYAYLIKYWYIAWFTRGAWNNKTGAKIIQWQHKKYCYLGKIPVCWKHSTSKNV